MGGDGSEGGPGQFASPGDAAAAAASAAGAAGVAPEQTVIPNLGAYVTVNMHLPLFVANPQLKAVVAIAVDRAIREIIQPVVERSVTIACITTKGTLCRGSECSE